LPFLCVARMPFRNGAELHPRSSPFPLMGLRFWSCGVVRRITIVPLNSRLPSFEPLHPKGDQMSDASFEVVNRHGEGLIKSVLAINGAAATAVLGFAPSLSATDEPTLSPWLIGTAFGIYILGMASALISYLSMNLFLMFDGDLVWSRKPNAEAKAGIARGMAYAFGILSGVIFIVSGFLIAHALRTM